MPAWRDADRLLPAKRAVHRHFLRLHRPDPAGFHARAGAAACAAGAGQRAVVPCAQPARRAAANGAGQARRLCAEPFGRAGAAVRGEPRLLRRDVWFGAADPHDSERAGADALHDADHGRGSICSGFCSPSGLAGSSWGCGSCWRRSLPAAPPPAGPPRWPGRS